jgi:hypothetical protein
MDEPATQCGDYRAGTMIFADDGTMHGSVGLIIWKANRGRKDTEAGV